MKYAIIYLYKETINIQRNNTVKDNTHLKGAVIDSKGDADKNNLHTGTLSWENVENKADYKAGGMGISTAPRPSTPAALRRR